MNRRAAISLGLLLLLLAGVVFWRLNTGGALWTLDASDRADYLQIRATRIAIGSAVGLCLAVAGVILQALLRNPLASPDITGMSSAASLGVMLALFIGSGAGSAPPEREDLWRLATGSIWQTGPALIGAMAALALVYALSQRRGLLDPTAMVLIGVIVSIMCGAGVLLIQHLMPGIALSPAAARLLIGSLSDSVGRVELIGASTIGVGATILAATLGPRMDAASLGDDEASSLGVSIRPFRIVLLALAGLLTAAAVVIAGPVGFIGLVAPHLVRLLMGAGLGQGSWGGTRLLTLGAALAGPALVVGADALVRAIELPSGRMPLGVVTAIAGGATFIALLRAQRRS